MQNKMLGAVLVCTLLLSACSSETKHPQQTHSVVLVTPASNGNLSEKSFSGVVKENEEIGVGFKIGGQLAQVFVKEGDFVRQGQVIAKIDDKDLKLTASSSRVRYNQLKDEVNRMERIYKQQGMSGNDYEKAQSGLELARIQMEKDENNVEYTVLRAPVSGYVLDVNFHGAEMVSAGSAVITLIDTNRFEVEMDVPTSIYLKQHTISGYCCSSSQLPGEVFALHLINITPKASGNQLYKVRLAMDAAAQKKLTPGMNVEVRLQMSDSSATATDAKGDAPQGCILPESAVFQSKEGKSCVWVLKTDSTINRKEVTIGNLLPGGMLQINSGLTGQEQVVRAGVDMLQEGEKVVVIAAPTQTNIGGII